MLDSLSLLMALLAPTPAPAQHLFVVESTNRRVLLFDEATGALVDPAYLDAGGLAPATTPIEALRAPSGELLVSDQVSDTVLRFSADRTVYLGSSPVPLNNVHGLAVAYGSIWVTNSGPNPVGPTNALVQLDQSLNLVATYALPGTPFDVLPFRWQGVDGFLLTDFDHHDILFFDPANPGALATFHASSGVGGVHFPMYLARSEVTGNVFCGGLIAPAGIYEYSGATGAQVRYIQNPGGQTQVRAAHPLFDGRILFTSDQGVHRYDPASGTATTLVANVNAHAISRFLDGRFGASYCTAVRNSTGVPAFLHAVGSPLRSLNDVELQCVSLPRNAAAFFLVSRTQGFVTLPAGSAGNLCLAGAIGRYVAPGQVRNSGLAGAVTLRLDLGRVPTPTGPVSVVAGETWSFQCWFRDSAGGAPTSNFSNGRALPFQ